MGEAIFFFLLLCLGIFLLNDFQKYHRETIYQAEPAARHSEAKKAEFISKCKMYSYADISRNPNSFIDLPCKFYGKVVQVSESFGLNIVLRVDTSRRVDYFGSWDDTIYVDYRRTHQNERRILEGDLVNIYGTLNGIKTYQTVLGGHPLG